MVRPYSGAMNFRLFLPLLAALLLVAPAEAKQPRSTAAKHAFQRSVPCPATGAARGRCPGYVIDHVVPLCAGGIDRPSNMQWQTVADSRRKDKGEFAECRVLRKQRGAL